MPRKKGKIVKTFVYEGRRYSVSGDTEVEALVKLKLRRKELEEGAYTVKTSMTVSEWGDRCLDIYRSGAGERTMYSYKNRAKNCIYKYIGNMRLKDVRPIHCQDCLNKQIGNSSYQIRQTKQLLYLFFSKAVQNHLIIENPASDLRTPKGSSVTRRALTSDERQYFLQVSDNNRYLALQLMYFCGLRPSEARECIGSDIKKIKGTNMLHVRGSKTESSDRYVPIPDELYEKIKNTPESAPIAPNEIGKKFSEERFNKMWKSFKREMNIAMGCETYRNKLVPPYPLAEDLVPYCLRHDFATRCASKYDIRTTQYLMGHADISITSNIYTHINEDNVLDIIGTTEGTT